MNRQQLSLVVILGLISSIPAFGAESSEQGGGWRTSSEDSAGSTLNGRLFRNSADANGSAPYVVLDQWGVVRGYVSAARGVELESCVGRQVSLQGTVKTLPGGDMPCMTCRRVLSGRGETRNASAARASLPMRDEAMTPVEEQSPREIAPRSQLPTRSDMAAEPAPRARPLPLHEVVLEPQAADDSQDLPAPPPARRTTARRLRATGAQAANYQEAIPTPVPTGGLHRAGVPADPVPEPVPMEEAHVLPDRPMLSEGPMVSEGPMISEGPAGGCGPNGCDACGEGPCDACCGGCCDEYCDNCCDVPCWGPRRPLFCWGPTGIWVKADYLQWWESGTRVPALVTTGGTAGEGALGQSDTKVLFGNGTLNDNSVSGGRIQAGMWLNSCATVGLEGEYFGLGDQVSNYYAWSDGTPIISRPFFDVNPSVNAQNVQNVAYPRGFANSCDGAINIHLLSHFYGTGAHLLFTVCRQEGCWTDDCCSCETFHDRYRADFMIGYRYLDQGDQLGITETITSTVAVPSSPDYLNAFLVHDEFDTHNAFNGCDVGMKFEFARNRWSLDLFPRIALGSTHSTVNIDGSTRNTNSLGQETTLPGGLLAQPSNSAAGYVGNIGNYSQDKFAVAPQLDMNLGYQITRHTRLVFGYSALYLSSVARAGEQIDTRVNSALLPFAPPTGTTATSTSAVATSHPQFNFQDSGFWAQGINVGIDCRW